MGLTISHPARPVLVIGVFGPIPIYSMTNIPPNLLSVPPFLFFSPKNIIWQPNPSPATLTILVHWRHVPWIWVTKQHPKPIEYNYIFAVRFIWISRKSLPGEEGLRLICLHKHLPHGKCEPRNYISLEYYKFLMICLDFN